MRAYPLRTVAEPSTIVIGDKAGQKVFNQGAPPPGMQAQGPPPSSAVNAPVGGGGMMGGPPPGMHGNMPFNHPAAQAAMINQQSNAMEQLERRREREREREKELAAAAARGRSGSASGVCHLIALSCSCYIVSLRGESSSPVCRLLSNLVLLHLLLVLLLFVSVLSFGGQTHRLTRSSILQRPPHLDDAGSDGE